MGIRAHLTQIPPQLLNALREMNRYEPDDELLPDKPDWNSFRKAFLDKAWEEFALIFKNADGPLRYAIEGNYHHPGGFEGWDYNIRDYYIGYVSSELVPDISAALSKPTYSELVSMFDQAGFEYDEYSQNYFEQLKHFYQQAAKDQDAVMIIIF